MKLLNLDLFYLKIFYIFWIFTSIYIIFKSIKVDQLNVGNETVLNIATTSSTFIKGLPAISAAIFVLVMRFNDSPPLFLLVGAFLFCFAGDLGIEKDILIGLSLFLIAQLLFSLVFLIQVFTIGFSVNVLFLAAIAVFIVVIYMLIFLQYLESSEDGLGSLKIPILAYCVVISLMLISSILLWGTLGKLEVIVVVIGALLFIISDSIIGIHEFHHKISRSVLMVMITYYSAIFLLSLSVFIL
ncbi:MAG: lysoplasmalogenase [Candidatus Hodarchaeota archaeon]